MSATFVSIVPSSEVLPSFVSVSGQGALVKNLPRVPLMTNDGHARLHVDVVKHCNMGY
jgi:hypothetical protein